MRWIFHYHTASKMCSHLGQMLAQVKLLMDRIPALQVQVVWLEPSKAFEVCDQYHTRSAYQLDGSQLCIEVMIE